MEPMTDLSFKCRFVKDRAVIGLGAMKSLASQTELIIGDDHIPYNAITIAHCFENRVVFNLSGSIPLGKKAQQALGGGHALIVEVQGNRALALSRHVNRLVSSIQADLARQEMSRKGESERFRTVICPHCGSTINVSGFDATTYTHCYFCQSILSKTLAVVSNGDVYGQCPACNLYGRVRSYFSFQFYFLIIVYGFSYRQVHHCDNCASKLAKRNLLTNLLFILGVPFAIAMWIRALSKRDAFLKTLDRANALAEKGKYEQSDPLYETLLQEYPEHPAVLMNQAMGHFNASEAQGGRALLERVLRSCSNYLPAILFVNRAHREATVATQYG
ncbi:MAG: hypothetical protein JXA21_20435 [Anaerolineae bacterium]|nr:hypothetical protein [Anaerolineae bacterium]